MCCCCSFGIVATIGTSTFQQPIASVLRRMRSSTGVSKAPVIAASRWLRLGSTVDISAIASPQVSASASAAVRMMRASRAGGSSSTISLRRETSSAKNETLSSTASSSIAAITAAIASSVTLSMKRPMVTSSPRRTSSRAISTTRSTGNEATSSAAERGSSSMQVSVRKPVSSRSATAIARSTGSMPAVRAQSSGPNARSMILTSSGSGSIRLAFAMPMKRRRSASNNAAVAAWRNSRNAGAGRASSSCRLPAGSPSRRASFSSSAR